MDNAPTRVLVVDDFKPFRRFVESVLRQQPQLQIIGELSDGLEAVRSATELQPDLILLDIGLPTLNGIEAARRIRAQSPKSKILFFSEMRSSEIVEAALSTGAVGYVVKSDAAGELLAAVEAVLRGKKFVSSSLSGHHGRHEVVLYTDDRQLLERLSQFLGAALKVGNAAIAVATDSHLDSLIPRLQAYGVDIAAAIQQGRYIPVDVTDILSTVMVNGMLDSARFLESFGDLILKAANAAEGEHPRVAVFGEGPDLLWKQGNAESAIQDEKLGNQLCKTHPVDILCGYSLDKVCGVEDELVLQLVCEEHSAVYRP